MIKSFSDLLRFDITKHRIKFLRNPMFYITSHKRNIKYSDIINMRKLKQYGSCTTVHPRQINKILVILLSPLPATPLFAFLLFKYNKNRLVVRW